MFQTAVIIPVHNRPELVKEAVTSVLNGTTACKLIVVDDGSDIPIFLENAMVVRLSKNSGVSRARNLGVTFADTEYVAFLDSDDLFLPNKLSLQLEFMEKHKLFASHTSEKWYKKGKFINQGKKHERYGGYIFDKILDICRISPSTFMIKREFFLKMGGFNERLLVCEDYEFFLRIALKTNIGYLDKQLTIKRAVDEGLSKSIKHIESVRLEILKKFAENVTIPKIYKTAFENELNRKTLIVNSGLSKKRQKY